MELRQIEYFVQLYKNRNITKASQTLFISQQGLSKSIIKLEKELGFSLFERTITGVTPTDQAKKLYPFFQKIADDYHNLDLKINDLRNERRLNIIAPIGFAGATERDLFSEYGSLHPTAVEQYMEDTKEASIQCLNNHTADLAFMIAPIPDELQSHHIVDRAPLFVVMNHQHPMAQKEAITISDLENCSLLFLDLYHSSNQLILDEIDSQNIAYQIYGHAKINDFLPLIDTSYLLGFSAKNIYRYHDISRVSFLPFFLSNGSSLYIETHLVTLKNAFLDDAMLQYINWVKSK